MSNFYKTYKGYAFGEHKDAFRVLNQVFQTFSLRFFLIGAQARDIHFYQKGIKPSRGTRDIDFAVMVESMDAFNELMEALEQEGFEKTRDPYRLNWNGGETVIDLLPFGQIEQDYTVNFTERSIELSVMGFREIEAELEEYFVSEDESISIPVPPLHGIFMLKLLSWEEKRPDRQKDLDDLHQILMNYWEFVEDEAYEDHPDLFDDEDFDIHTAAARILGRHLRKTMGQSEVLNNRIIHILTQQAAQVDPPGPMLRRFAWKGSTPIDQMGKYLELILEGTKD